MRVRSVCSAVRPVTEPMTCLPTAPAQFLTRRVVDGRLTLAHGRATAWLGTDAARTA
jgi:hypothetical protein